MERYRSYQELRQICKGLLSDKADADFFAQYALSDVEARRLQLTADRAINRAIRRYHIFQKFIGHRPKRPFMGAAILAVVLSVPVLVALGLLIEAENRRGWNSDSYPLILASVALFAAFA